MFNVRVILLLKLVFFTSFAETNTCLAEDFSIIANKIIFNKQKGYLQATGNVTIELDSVKLQTDNLIYDQNLEKIKIKSALLIKTKNGARVISDFAEINKSTQQTIATNIKALIEKRFNEALFYIERVEAKWKHSLPRLRNRLEHSKSRSSSEILVYFYGFWGSFPSSNNPILDLIRLSGQKVNIRVVQTNNLTAADIVICSCYSGKIS